MAFLKGREKTMIRILILLLVCLVALVLVAAAWQRRLLYFPTHHTESNGLKEWRHEGELIGYSREVAAPRNVWLLTHGNAGQASDRIYALPAFASQDSVFILEYPGYGARPGTPSRKSLDAAARQGYRDLRARFPRTPVCVAGESIGSGPACVLATEQVRPDKIVLVVPFDTLLRLAMHHFPYLPVRILLADDWDNIESLKGYPGRVEIFAAKKDDIIPPAHAKALADSKPGAVLHLVDGGHNDWSTSGQVAIRNP